MHGRKEEKEASCCRGNQVRGPAKRTPGRDGASAQKEKCVEDGEAGRILGTSHLALIEVSLSRTAGFLKRTASYMSKRQL